MHKTLPIKREQGKKKTKVGGKKTIGYDWQDNKYLSPSYWLINKKIKTRQKKKNQEKATLEGIWWEIKRELTIYVENDWHVEKEKHGGPQLPLTAQPRNERTKMNK